MGDTALDVPGVGDVFGTFNDFGVTVTGIVLELSYRGSTNLSSVAMGVVGGSGQAGVGAGNEAVGLVVAVGIGNAVNGGAGAVAVLMSVEVRTGLVTSGAGGSGKRITVSVGPNGSGS